LYGRQPVLEVLRAGRREVFRLLLLESARPSPDMDELVAAAEQRGVAAVKVSPGRLEDLAGDVHHQGVLAEVGPYPYVTWESVLESVRAPKEPPLFLLLDHVQDPQNLGSLLRTADASGVHAVLIPTDRAVGVTPAAVRASSGAADHLRVALVTNLVRSMAALKEEGLWFAGLETTAEARLYTQVDLKGPLGLVVGSEGSGLGRLVRETCDHLIRIPMFGRVGSLNAGVAGALALYEIRRQRSAA
jgi:23S rRNA (guanosine2251-2'-O)-methyltransferase